MAEWKDKFKELELLGSGGKVPLKSSIRDIQAFADNRVWQDISEQLMFLLISMRDDLEAIGEGHDRNEITYLQGQCLLARHVLSMPETFINSFKKEGEEELDEPQ